MAILFDVEANEYEVRIKRYPEGTYFEEHVKTERRERDWDQDRERYIIGESGAKFTIEVTLRKGFYFVEYDVVQAQLFLPGRDDSVTRIHIHKPSDLDGKRRTTSDIIDQLQYADVEIGGKKVLGARFAFRDLVIDGNLANETDVIGIDPESLGNFVVNLCKFKWDTRKLTDKEYATEIQEVEVEVEVSDNNTIGTGDRSGISSVTNTSQLQNLWDAGKVDKSSFKIYGITLAIGFVGGLPKTIDQVANLTPLDISLTIDEITQVGSDLYVTYYYRTKEFLDQSRIIKYPPPIYAFPWKSLDKGQKKAALRKLQAISYKRYCQSLESKTGQILPKFKSRENRDDPKEWRPWNMMNGDEREVAFETLQQQNATCAKVLKPIALKVKHQKTISLIDDEEDERDSEGKIEKEIGVDLPEISDANEKSIQAKAVAAYAKPTADAEAKASGGPKVNKEPIDQDSGQVKNGETQENGPIARPVSDASSNAEIERKKAKLKRLAEEIEEEEKIRTLKRQRRALEEEIEEAERKKNGKK